MDREERIQLIEELGVSLGVVVFFSNRDIEIYSLSSTPRDFTVERNLI